MTLCVHTIVSSLSWPRIVLVLRNMLVVYTLYVLTVRAQNSAYNGPNDACGRLSEVNGMAKQRCPQQSAVVQ